MTEADAEHEAIADTWRNVGASDYEYLNDTRSLSF